LSIEGKFIAVLLMTGGVGLFSALSGALAAWFMARDDEGTASELGSLRDEVAALRALIEERMTKVG
jgi:hypothetical protein